MKKTAAKHAYHPNRDIFGGVVLEKRGSSGNETIRELMPSRRNRMPSQYVVSCLLISNMYAKEISSNVVKARRRGVE